MFQLTLPLSESTVVGTVYSIRYLNITVAILNIISLPFKFCINNLRDFLNDCNFLIYFRILRLLLTLQSLIALFLRLYIFEII